MPSRRILQLGDPLLHAISTPVSDVSTTAPIFRDLRATLHEFRRTHGFGRGISAVQIGEPTRLIYIEMAGEEYRLMNPELESRSEETFRLWDDCFSFPELMVRVRRHVEIDVAYLDESGGQQRVTARGDASPTSMGSKKLS
jgi:peptide deformylase